MYKSSDKLINNDVNNIQLFNVLSGNRPAYFYRGTGNTDLFSLLRQIKKKYSGILPDYTLNN